MGITFRNLRSFINGVADAVLAFKLLDNANFCKRSHKTCSITLFTIVSHAMEVSVAEASGVAIIDTACTKTVCGESGQKVMLTASKKTIDIKYRLLRVEGNLNLVIEML